MATVDEQIRELEAKRASIRAATADAEAEQRLTDLRALVAAEEEHGANNVDTLEIPFTEGLPMTAIVRTPTKTAMKIYKDRLKEGKKPDTEGAANELAKRCLEYPDAETFDRMVSARPGIQTQAGLVALKLSIAKVKAEGED